jgi:hypothetical protein
VAAICGISCFYGRGQQIFAESIYGEHISPQIWAETFFIFPQMNHATTKMNNGHAGSAVAAVLAALKSPLQKKKYRYSPSSGWSRDNYSISLK